jgi:autotransporter-associated beta strand protein
MLPNQMKPKQIQKLAGPRPAGARKRYGAARLAMLLGLAAVGVATHSAYGDWVGDVSSDWNNASNWGGDVFPTTPNDAIVNNTGGPGVFPVINGNAAFTPRDIRVGTAGAAARVDHLSGTIGTGDGNWFFLGYLGSTPVYNLANTAGAGGALTGFAQGSGSLQIGGATQNGNFLLGLDNGTTSTLNINTTGSITGGGMFLGAAGGSNGIVNLDSGTVSFSGEIQVGANFFSQGSGTNNQLNVSGGTITGNIISLARGANNAAAMTGTVNVTGGVVNSRQWFTLGFAGSATDTSVVNNNGGTINVNTGGGGVLEMGVFDATNNTFNQNSGNTTLQNNASIQFGNGGNHSGTSTFNQNGGGVTFYSNAGTTIGGTGALNLGNGGSTGNYTYNLNGGTLKVPTISKTAAGATGTFNFNGGTLQPTGNNSNFVSGLTRINVRNGGAVINTNGFDVGFQTPLNHSNIGGDNAIDGGLTKSGSGALGLNGTSDYTGNTTINGGSVIVGAGTSSINSSGAINVNGTGARFATISSTAVTPTVTVTNGGIDGTGTINTAIIASNASNTVSNGLGGATPLTVGDLTFQGAGNFSLNVGGTSPVVNTTNLSTSGSGNILVNATNANWLPGTYNLVGYSALLGSGFAAFQKGAISGLSGRQSATLTNPAGFISLVIAGDNPKWTGALSSSWTTATLANPKNWALITGGTPTDYINGDVVLFDDTASNFTVNVTDATVTPQSTTFNNPTNNYILNGPGSVAGSGSLTKNGSGALTINNANTYSAGTTLNAGTLNINNASAIGTGNLTVAAGTTLDNTSGSPVTLSTNNNQAWNGNFTFGGSNALNLGNGTATINTNRTVTVNGSNLTVTRIAQSGVGLQLTKAGPGTLTISGTGSTYSGATNINGGTLAVTGSLTSTSAVNVTGGSVVSASGTLTTGIVTITNGSAVVGSGGTLTSTGDFWVARGNQSVGDLQVQNGGTLNADVLLVAGGDGPANTSTATATIAAGGTLNTTRWFVAGHSGVTSTGTVTVNGNLNVRTSGGQGNVEIGTWDTINANLIVNPGAVVKIENNAEIIMGAQTHSGTSTMTQNGGSVAFYSDAGNTANGTGNLIMGGAGGSGTYTYNLNGGTLTTARIRKDNGTANSTFNFNSGTLKPTGSATNFLGGITRANVRNGGAIIDTNGFNITVSQALEHSNVGGDNATDGGLTKNGAGTLVMAGVATYTGATNVNAGTLQLPSGAAPVAVGRYNFDELPLGSLAQGTIVLNTGSGAGLNGTVNHTDNQFDPVNGGASVVVGQTGYGNALSLDGLGSTIDVASKIVDQSGNGSWTASAWIKTATNGSSIFSKNASGNTWAGGHSVFYLGSNPISGTPGTLPTAVRNGGGFIQGNTSVVDDTWHMVTFVDNGGVKTIYVDGVAAAMNYTNFDAADTATFTRLGFNTDTLANLDGNANFAGLMDEMQFYNVTLTGSQVASLFTTDSVSGGGQQYLPTTTPLTIASSATLDLNGNNQTIGSLSGAAGSAVALGAGTLTTNGNGASTTFGGVISGAGGLTKTGAGLLVIPGANTYAGPTTVQNGTLRIENSLTSTSAVHVANGARLELPSDGTKLRVIKTGTVLTAGTGKIDIADNKLIATASPAGSWNGTAYTDVTGLIASGRNGNAAPLWDGNGIITTQSSATSGNYHSIGVARASDVRPATATATGLWAGQTITGTDTLVMFTYGGDATLDGKINVDDYIKIDSGIAAGLTGWSNGDFNYDGKVNIDDYTTVIDANIGNQSGVFPTAGGIEGGGGLSSVSGVSAVPEPAATGIIMGLASAALMRRRRAHRQK